MMAEEGTFKEKRLFRRYPCNLRGDYWVEDGSLRGIVRLRDISTRGAGLVITDPLTVGVHLEIKIIDENIHPLTLKGEVRWCRKISDRWYGGVMFDRPLFLPLKTIK